DHLVERRDGDELPFENMAAPLRLAQEEFGAPADDLHPVPEELLQHLLDRQRARPAIDEGKQDDADRLLQWRKLIELVEHDLRVGVTLDVDDDAYRLAGAGARLIAHGGDALDAVFFDHLTDLLGKAVARLLVRDLVNDDLRARAFLVDGGAGAQDDFAAAG